ncbi:ORF170 [Saltwater crocodilepox virus]|nr:ORF170 [Saltwater crocodilepox virus]QGT47039.1 ORF170 [Saltwater crocodilepox virus]QGT47252.1 ORF170 [Saltwater crocodilepox virus]QGT47684.1 ORF167 [Saltwater crocodilepox virus]QGT47896.1 ORF170 [Saltwater crocodilepox virus]
MNPSKSLITLDQLENADYLFKLVTTVVPVICLDYEVPEALKHAYVHPLDAVFKHVPATVYKEEEFEAHYSQVGINYAISRFDASTRRYFPLEMTPGAVIADGEEVLASRKSNPILCTQSFHDLPAFTRMLMKIRTSCTEQHARFFGGYVHRNEVFEVGAPFKYPHIEFQNQIVSSLLWDDVVVPSSSEVEWRIQRVDGKSVLDDVEALYGVYELLLPASQDELDRMYGLADLMAEHNLRLPARAAARPVHDLTTMDLEPLLLYFRYFMSYEDGAYDPVLELGTILYNGIPVAKRSEVYRYALSVFYQEDLPAYAVVRGLTLDNAIALPGLAGQMVPVQGPAGTRYLPANADARDAAQILELIKDERLGFELPEFSSLFWDGIPFDDYKNLGFRDATFRNSTCYVLGLYQRDDVIYCSMLQDVLAAGELPFRVCFLPRLMGSRTLPQLTDEILRSLNSATAREFPYRQAQAQHLGLSSKNFFRFLGFLRMVSTQNPAEATKEVMITYAGMKTLEDKGVLPFQLNNEMYKQVLWMVLTAMGFRLTISERVRGSFAYTRYFVRPSLTKNEIRKRLSGFCKEIDVEKIMSACTDLLSFLLSATYTRYGRQGQEGALRDGMRGPFRYGTLGPFRCGDAAEFVDRLSVLERVNVGGIMSANAVNEYLDVDVFRPENAAFRANLRELLEREGGVTGDDVVELMPLSALDKYTFRGGDGGVSVSALLDNINDPQTQGNITDDVIEIVNAALKETYLRDAYRNVAGIFNQTVAKAEGALNRVQGATCNMHLVFKEIAKSVYTLERLTNVRLDDDFKARLLEMYNEYYKMSVALYQDLISLDSLKNIVLFIRRNGQSISDYEITEDDLRKSFDVVKHKIGWLTSRYTELCRIYFDEMKKNLSAADADVFFEEE